MSNEVLDKALGLAERGYYVLPLLIREDGRKIPLIKWGSNTSKNAEDIRAMPWEDATHVAVACEPSGIVVVDIDTYYDEDAECLAEGEDLLHEWMNLALANEEQDNDEILDPPWVLTQGNGLHVFLKANPDKPITNSTKSITHCIDLRGAGGQFGGIVAIYAEDMPAPDDLPVVPDWLYELAQANARTHDTPKAPPEEPKYGDGEAGTDYGLKALSGELRAVQEAWDADEGNFNHLLNKSAYSVGQLAGGGELDVGHAHQAIVDLLQELGAPSDQYKTLDSGFSSGYDHPRSAKQALKEIKVTPEAVAEMSRKWLSGDSLDQLPPPKWLVPGWLEYDSVAQIYGAPKTGKSFVALDMAARLSRGMGWPTETNTPTRPVRVAYIIAEGVRGFVLRKRAWEATHGRMGEIKFYPDAIQIGGEDGEWKIAIEYLSQWNPALIIVDTQARCMIGVDENKPVEINKRYPELEEMRKRTGACVLLVHHTNKPGDSARGSNAILANINTEIRVSKSYGRVRVRNTAQKNAEEANEVYFSLETIAESVVPRLSAEVPADMADAVKVNHSHLLIRQYLESHLDVPQTTNEILEDTGLAKSNFYKTIKFMIEEGQVTKTNVYRNNRNQAAYSWVVSPESEGS